MKAGDLKHIIVFQTLVSEKSNFGSTTEYYTDTITTRCAARKDKADRELINSEIFHSSTLIFHIRFYHKIDESMRIVYKDKKYRIISIFTDDLKQQHEIKAELINE